VIRLRLLCGIVAGGSDTQRVAPIDREKDGILSFYREEWTKQLLCDFWAI
jgi:hypothetical protein